MRSEEVPEEGDEARGIPPDHLYMDLWMRGKLSDEDKAIKDYIQAVYPGYGQIIGSRREIDAKITKDIEAGKHRNFDPRKYVNNLVLQERLKRAMDKSDPKFVDMASAFLEAQPLYYDKAGLWWAWNYERTCWEIIDDIDILNVVSKHNQESANANFVVFKKDHIVTSLRMAARLARPAELPKRWVQFRDVILDTATGSMQPATPAHFCVNPIPWKLAASSATPTIDKLFRSWVDEKSVETLYEILSYCVLCDYPIHRAFCFIGTGRNGKSQYLQLVQRFVGMMNVCTASITRLESNSFAAFNLYKKLVCVMGETNYGKLDATDLFKRLTGQDVIEFEKKGKDSINDHNYAKILISTNGLPTSMDDSDGFYRRWTIIEFPNTFPEGRDIVAEIPDSEFEALARRVVETLPELLRRGKFTNEGTIDERKRMYRQASNPLEIFLDDGYERNADGRVKYNYLFDEYKRWLAANKRRVVKRSEFKEALVQEGYDVDRQRYGEDAVTTWVVTGLRQKVPLEKFTALPQSATLDDGRNAKLPDRMVTKHETLSNAIVNRQDLLDTIKSVGVGGVAAHTDLVDLWPGEEIGQLLSVLLSEGAIFSPRPGYYGVLE